MTKHMLIDATHPEETRVVVVSGKRLEEFDAEIASKKQLKGNIYLAKVVRVEPSLQAAFVDYGGNRHGFLAFNEIHPDYYRIPIADREALQAELEAEAEERTSEEEEEDGEDSMHASAEGAERVETEPTADDADLIDSLAGERAGGHGIHEEEAVAQDETDDEGAGEEEDAGERAGPALDSEEAAAEDRAEPDEAMPLRRGSAYEHRLEGPLFETDEETGSVFGEEPSDRAAAEGMASEPTDLRGDADLRPDELPAAPVGGIIEERTDVRTGSVETVGGEEVEEDEAPRRPRLLRRYKIQEVIKRRQIMLVQVTKEERGTKGAALTTYLSLAGRYCVLMPNTARGGGVSRKITSANDRKRLKSVIEELDIPKGMAVIVRTAGSERNKTEIKRDYEYLLRLWGEIRDLTLRSTAPALIYEEANLIKRSIRDLYTRDIEDIIVEGEEGYKAAKAFMKMLTPSHARRVQHYRDASIPLFQRYQIESQLDALHNPVVQLKSGGYIVINQTEALVAIDVNSGRATRERNIEDTALRTNLEAAEEIARQLRLRDLAGLIVIDFIDMEEQRHNVQVERRLKEAMRLDRARIQIGRISPFGLLELSRQRLRPSLFEASTEICRYCRGLGRVRSTESTALHVLRAIEEEGTRRRSPGVTVTVPTPVALYILNQKRRALAEIERRYGFRVYLGGDDNLIPPEFRLDRLRALAPGEELPAPAAAPPVAPAVEEEEAEVEAEVEAAAPEVEEEKAEGVEEAAERRPEGETERTEGGRRRRRRRRRGGRGREGVEEGRREGAVPAEAAPEPVPASEPIEGEAEAAEPGEAAAAGVGAEPEGGEAHPAASSGETRRRRRRGRRGGRRRSRRRQMEGGLPMEGGAQPEGAPPRGPRPLVTPADFDRDWPYSATEEAEEEFEGEEAFEAEPEAEAVRGEAAEGAPTAAAPAPAAAYPADQPTAAAPNPQPPRDPASYPAEQPTVAAPHPAPAAPAPEEAPAPLGTSEPTAVMAEGKDEPAPPRRGWWRRGS
jgi:ribonuclease E